MGSRSAPIWTPTSGVFFRDFSYLLQFWLGSRFAADSPSVLIHTHWRPAIKVVMGHYFPGEGGGSLGHNIDGCGTTLAGGKEKDVIASKTT